MFLKKLDEVQVHKKMLQLWSNNFIAALVKLNWV